MLKKLLLVVILLLSNNLFAQTATQPSGTGTSGDPYLIATLDNLYWVTQNPTEWSKVYKQTAAIDASSSSTWASGAGFSPIGNFTNQFTGSYDGQYYSISGLFINRSLAGYIGMFGYIGSAGAIQKVCLLNVNITGNNIVGSIVGVNLGSVSNCFSTGSIGAGNFGIGGFVGQNQGTITNSYTTCSVANANNYAGGFASRNYATITNCFATGSVNGSGYSGGLISYNGSGGNVNYCYSTGLVTGSGNVGGLIGSNGATVTNCYWDTLTSGKSTSAAGTGKTTTEMKTQSTYTGWDFTTVWAIDPNKNSGYPYLLWQSSITGVDNIEKTPSEFALYQNYPNPFNPSTMIRYEILKQSKVKITVYNMLGQVVQNLFEGEKAPGNYELNFDASKLSTGVYFYRIEAGSFSETKKMNLLK